MNGPESKSGTQGLRVPGSLRSRFSTGPPVLEIPGGPTYKSAFDKLPSKDKSLSKRPQQNEI